MKHTQGPWQLSSVPFEMRNSDSAASIYGPYTKDGGACFIAEISRSPGNDEATANAKLIAAAPELLDALQSLMNVYETKGQLLSFDVNIARNAIKKATE